MLKNIGIIVSCILLTICVEANGGQLVFPKNASEIIEALSFKDGKVNYDGVDYLVENGQVYQLINGKRYRVRGLNIIVNLTIMPRVGALVHFDFGSEKVKPESYPLLDEFGAALKSGLSGSVVVIAGHTDAVGSSAFNQNLSERRAQSVARYLTKKHGINADRLHLQGYGMTVPISTNETDKGRALNRRVEFVRIE